MNKVRMLWVALLCPIILFGQYRNKPQMDFPSLLQTPAALGRAATNLLGLDPSRMTMQHSYQMSFMNAGGHGFSQGLYLNTISYQFTLPITMSVQWGIANQPFGNIANNSALLKNGPFLSAAQFRYQPKPNMVLQIDYRHMPYSYDPYGYYGYMDSPWSRW
jgi:hypothetical protein